MTQHDRPTMITDRSRPPFPKRAVVTGGMPYGNKDLHFGHIGGVFVHADCFARFLRDRLGAQNVIFVSGTDCYGSPIVEYHRHAQANGEFSGSLEEFVAHNHARQKETFAAYNISLDLFAGSAFEPHGALHRDIGAWILKRLHQNGYLLKRTTPQFYDPEYQTFLNGRQVQGKCPVHNCRADKAYADECELGHQYEPRELLNPTSTLSGRTPEMRDVTNWYLDLPALRKPIAEWLQHLRQQPGCRHYMVSYMLEFFEPPTIHITKDQMAALEQVKEQLAPHQQKPGRGKSIQLVFAKLADMEKAREILAAANIRYRSGKTLVPFRLTGNLEWGLPAPNIEGLSGLTFWVWPESLWAPISFTASYLQSQGADPQTWRDWWCDPCSQVYQFIGEDNIFFYGLAQAGIWLGLQEGTPDWQPQPGQLNLTTLVANKHLLFMDKKASSSGRIKPPMAKELLNYYTADQLRAHFFSLGLGLRSVSFRPKPFNPKATPKEGDPVLKEGNLLSNTFNRAVRSCFYTVQKYYAGIIPVGPVDPEVVTQTETAVLDFEEAMHRLEFHQALTVVGNLLRSINQRWSKARPYHSDTDPEVRQQALIDAFYQVKTATVLMHPIAPQGTEKIREFLGFDEQFWSWEHIFQPIYYFMSAPQQHKLRFLEPRVDFFEKHPSQIKA